jgi:hypothetical protein
MLVKILVLVASLISTLSALGGETWTKGTEPLPKRITPRGWISVFSLMCALLGGVYDTVASHRREEKLDGERKEAKAQLDRVHDQLETANTLLGKTNGQLRAANDQLIVTNDQLNKANSHLDALTAASLSGRKAASATLDVFLGNGKDVCREHSTVECVFPGLSQEYKEIAKFIIELDQYGDREGIQYSFRDDELIDLQKVRTTYDPPRPVRISSRVTGWLRVSFFTPEKEIRPHDAALVYAHLSEAQLNSRSVGRVTLAFERDFSSKADLDTFVQAHAGLKVVKRWSVDESGNPGVEKLVSAFQARAEFAMPDVIRDSFVRYWKDHFHDGSLTLDLSPANKTQVFDASGSAISAAVTIAEGVKTASRATVSFLLKGRPRLTFGGN